MNMNTSKTTELSSAATARNRLLLLAVLTFSTVLPVQAANNDNWRFQVLLDDKPIGQHHFTVANNSGQTQVRNNARFDVKFLGFTAYTYQHNNIESWENNCLSSMQASTNDNGEQLMVKAQRNGNALSVNTGENDKTLMGCLRSFAYWSLPYMKSPQLLNSQTGELVKTQLQPMGAETITAGGQPVAAQRYRLTGKDIQIDLWYSAQNRWLGLESLKDGRRIRYVLQ